MNVNNITQTSLSLVLSLIPSCAKGLVKIKNPMDPLELKVNEIMHSVLHKKISIVSSLRNDMLLTIIVQSVIQYIGGLLGHGIKELVFPYKESENFFERFYRGSCNYASSYYDLQAIVPLSVIIYFSRNSIIEVYRNAKDFLSLAERIKNSIQNALDKLPETVCSICHEEAIQDPVLLTDCPIIFHVFCRECIDAWKENRISAGARLVCPVCQATIVNKYVSFKEFGAVQGEALNESLE